MFTVDEDNVVISLWKFVIVLHKTTDNAIVQ